MKVQVTKVFRFESAHYLPFHAGKCQNMHGHNYKLEVTVSGGILVDTPQAGMVMDFGNLKQLVKDLVVDPCDHKCLNDVEQFGFSVNPTAENMVFDFQKTLREELHILSMRSGQALHLERLKLWETDDCYVEWTRT